MGGRKRPGLAETDAESCGFADKMKTVLSGDVCDHEGLSELDTSVEV